jgi:hypothetical protein
MPTSVKRPVLSSKRSISIVFMSVIVNALFSFMGAASFSNILLMPLQPVKQHALLRSGRIKLIYRQTYIMA